MHNDTSDVRQLLAEKPNATPEDIERVKAGEPLAYVLGNQPFLGLTIGLASRPLIPRPETEWWTEELAQHIGVRPLKVLDLCAGSGAIGLALAAHCPTAKVALDEIVPEHVAQIQENAKRNLIEASRLDVRQSDLFAAFKDETFDIIATNPPYIPEPRELDGSVADYEPHEALFAGEDGLSIIRRIAKEAKAHMNEGGELWMECDVDNVEEAARLLREGGARDAQVRIDPYGRPRLAVAYY